MSKEYVAADLAEVRKLLENDEGALAAFEKHRSDRMEVASWSSSSSSSSSRVSAPAQHIVEHYTTTQSPPRSGHERGAYAALPLLAGKNQKVSKEYVAAVLAEVRKLLENDEEALAAFEKHRSDRMEVASSSSSSSSSSSGVSASAQHIVKHYTTTQSPPRAGQKRGAYDAMTLLAGKKQKVSKEREAESEF